MQSGKFALGIAWDGDCDRCVFFDGSGKLVPTYYLVGVLAEHYLKAYPGAAIVYDLKLCMNTLDIIQQPGSNAYCSSYGIRDQEHTTAGGGQRHC